MKKNHSRNDSNNNQNKKNQSGFSYTLFLVILTLVAIVIAVGLYWASFCSGLIKGTDNPSSIQFFIINIFSLLVFCAVVFQAFVYWKQWKAMQEQRDLMQKTIDGAEETLIYSQCAYVTASIDHRDGDVWYLRIENGGNTPANEVRVNYDLGWLKEAPECCRWDGKDAAWGSTKSKIYGVIAPKGFYRLRIDCPNSHDEGEKFYCWGTIDFSDIFRKRLRQAKFAFVRSSDDPDGTPCESFNEAY